MQLNSPHNEEINLTSIVRPNSTIFAYAQHCHEATVALALALHDTNEGEYETVCVTEGVYEAVCVSEGVYETVCVSEGVYEAVCVSRP